MHVDIEASRVNKCSVWSLDTQPQTRPSRVKEQTTVDCVFLAAQIADEIDNNAPSPDGRRNR